MRNKWLHCVNLSMVLIQCTECKRGPVHGFPSVVCPLTIPAENKCDVYELLESNFHTWKAIESPGHCEACNVVSLETKGSIQNPGRVLIFQLNIVNDFYQKVNNLKLSGVPSTEIKINDKIYSFSGAVFHHGKSINSGHYTAIVRKNNQFYKINDNVVSICTWPRNSKEVYLLFYVQK